MMTKRQIIERIIRLNRTAAPEFLAQFDERDLLAYLRQLSAVRAERRRDESRELATAAV